jgi:hypothetical protein
MREIVIKTVTKEEGYHIVRLGNGTVHRFTSDKAARKFLADTNRFLTGLLFNLNSALADIYIHGRELWIITDEVQERDHVNEQISALEFYLKQSIIRAPYKSGNYLAVIDLRKFCEHAKKLIKYLLNIKYVRQTDTLRKHKLENLFNQVHGYEMQLMNYGQLQAYAHFNTSAIEQLPFDFATSKTQLKIA